jgi:peptidoglycan/LPS O-acetylase OafA/YrhL
MLKEKRRDIQGLRAVAVALVVLFHAGVPGFGGGYVGVDVFFVISGFLISTHLLEALGDSGRLRFGEFYARRARRLLPAALTVIAVTVIAAFAVVSPVQFTNVIKDALAAALYVPNMVFALRATDYLADRTPSLFLHYWSLGVEEQFYLFWPLLLFILYRVFKGRGVPAAMTVITAASFAACVWLTVYKQPFAFFLLPSRVWEFGLGALVAIAVLHGRRLPASAAPAVGWIGLIALVASGCLMSASTPYPGYAVALPVVATALAIWAGSSRAAYGPVVLLGWRPITFVGDISYSLYLVHWPALVLPAAATGYMVPLPLWARAGIAASCIPLAWLLYRYVEQPGQRIAWLKVRPRRTLAAAVAGMLAIAALTGAASLANKHPRLDAGRPAADTMIGPRPVGTPFVPNNMRPSLTTVAADIPVTYRNGCHLGYPGSDPTGCTIGPQGAPRVVLFGDSHAAQWYPALSALADKGVLQLESHTKSACPSVRPTNIYKECDTWASRVVDRLNHDPPDLIVLGNYGRYYYGDDLAAWRAALDRTVAQMPSKSQIVVLADTPSVGVDPSICLGQYVDAADKCSLPRERALDAGLRDDERDPVEGITYLDYTDLFCDQTKCPTIIGNTLVYRDDTHMTTTYSAQLADSMSTDIQQQLILAGRN